MTRAGQKLVIVCAERLPRQVVSLLAALPAGAMDAARAARLAEYDG